MFPLISDENEKPFLFSLKSFSVFTIDCENPIDVKTPTVIKVTNNLLNKCNINDIDE